MPRSMAMTKTAKTSRAQNSIVLSCSNFFSSKSRSISFGKFIDYLLRPLPRIRAVVILELPPNGVNRQYLDSAVKDALRDFASITAQRPHESFFIEVLAVVRYDFREFVDSDFIRYFMFASKKAAYLQQVSRLFALLSGLVET